MSALLRTVTVYLRPMEQKDVEEVGAIEREAYAFPWSKGIFTDCLRAGHVAWVVEEEGQIHAYSLMAVAAGEAHLLNLCVRPRCHRRGFGRVLLSQMLAEARARRAQTMFLEVRPSNRPAIALYHKMGFSEVGTRPGYYPAHNGKEDALILALQLSIPKRP